MRKGRFMKDLYFDSLALGIVQQGPGTIEELIERARGRCGPVTLAQRIRKLVREGLATKDGETYSVTDEGAAQPALDPEMTLERFMASMRLHKRF